MCALICSFVHVALAIGSGYTAGMGVNVQFPAQQRGAAVIGVQGRGAVVVREVQVHQAAVVGFHHRVGGQQALGAAQRRVELAPGFVFSSQALQALQEHLAQPFARPHDPLIVAGGQQIAAVEVHGGLQRLAVVGDPERGLEIGRVQVKRPVAAPFDMMLVEAEKAIGIG